MKNFTKLVFSLFILWLIGLTNGYGQLIVTIDKEVGCIQYENIDLKQYYLDETIRENTACITVCENNVVTATVDYFDPAIVSIDWHVIGGTVVSYTAFSATIRWYAAGGGFINLTVYKTDGSSYQASVCVDIKPAPNGNIRTTGFQELCLNTDLYFEFENTTSENLSYLWDFGDGVFSSAQNPVHSYQQPGDYTVILEATNDCNCTSGFKIDVRVVKESGIDIECIAVTCEGKTETYNVVNPSGETILWVVEGGIFVDEEGAPLSDTVIKEDGRVDVLWNNKDGYITSHGYGVIYYNILKSYCQEWIAVRVPVVPLKMEMGAPDIVCQHQQAFFSLPQWASTDYRWSIRGYPNTDSTNLVLTDQRNEVFVDISEAGTYMLVCHYTNTIFGCSGISQYQFYVEEAPVVSGNTEVCKKDTVTYTIGNLPSNTELTVKPGYYFNGINHELLGRTVSTENNTFDISFPETGTYYLYARTSEACPPEFLEVRVVGLDSIPDVSIVGSRAVCFGTSEKYSLSSSLPAGIEVEWKITGGTLSSTSQLNSLASDEVTAIFNNTASQHSLTAYFRDEKHWDCIATDSISINIVEKSNSATQIQFFDGGGYSNMPATFIVCPSTVDSLFAVIPYGYEQIRWELSSENFGNISGANTRNPIVSWNNGLISTQSCKLNLYLTTCGQTQLFQKNITIRPAPTITFATTNFTVCSGTDYYPALNSNAVLDNAVVKWQSEFFYQTSRHNGSNRILIAPALTFINYTDSIISIPLTVTIDADNMCRPVVITCNIDVMPQPSLSVTPGSTSVCDITDANWEVVLRASTQYDLLRTTTEWFKISAGGAASLVGNTHFLNVNSSLGIGSYYAVSTDTVFGCTTISRIIEVKNGCPGNFDGSIDCNEIDNHVRAELIDCNTIRVTSESSSPFHEWTYDNEYLDMEELNDGEALFITEHPGVYDFTYTHRYDGSCLNEEISESVIVPYSPEIRYKVECNNNSQYTVTLYNNSEYLKPLGPNAANLREGAVMIYEVFGINGIDIIPDSYGNLPFIGTGNFVDYLYYIQHFGIIHFDPTYNSYNNIQSDSVKFVLSPGEYNIYLKMQGGMESGPIIGGIAIPHHFPPCAENLTLKLPPFPTATFTLTNNTLCPETAVLLKPDNYDSSMEYWWKFNNVTDNIAATNDLDSLYFMPATTLSNDVKYDIYLYSRNKYGCEASTMQTVTIQTWELAANSKLNGNSVICHGSTTELEVYEASGNSIGSQQWYRGNDLLPGETGSTLNVTESGLYYAKVTTLNGCEAPNTDAINIHVKPPIKVSIISENNACATEDILVTGRIKAPTPEMRYRWASEVSWPSAWAAVPTDGLVSETINLTSGTMRDFVVILEVVDTVTSCRTFVGDSIKYMPPPEPSEILFMYGGVPGYSAGLYTIVIGALNSQAGTFKWSNGVEGNTMVITHGGLYQVTFTNKFGCSSVSKIIVPRDPKEYMWIVPEGGCFWRCDPNKLNLLGPSPYALFSDWQWLENGYAANWGSGAVNDHSATGTKDIGLGLTTMKDSIGQTIYTESKSFNLSPLGCGNCSLNAEIYTFIQEETEPFFKYKIVFMIYNPNPYPLSMVISPYQMSDGFFMPNTVTVPARTRILFATDFYYMNTNSNAAITISLFGSNTDMYGRVTNCELFVTTPRMYAPPRNDSEGEQSQDIDSQTLNIYPNPATSEVNIAVTATSKDNRVINIYSLDGRSLFSAPCPAKENNLRIDLSSWQQGTFIVVLRQNNRIVQQGYFIKK
jgi:PKD repeat protein